ncbi:hypothetical protein BDB01DRAFT_332331 [Pilobolus umbonatus]|nr:hypothetical protein BDB01DRAFT_332331 [Pilobolus umbonatus]
MFHLDEEMSEEDREELSHDEDMVSEGEIEEKMDDIGIVDSKPGTSWMRRKRNMDKYLVHDFHIKKESRDNVDTVTQYATSVPVSIQYRLADTNIEKSADTKQESILSKSFANYDFSYSDRLISEQLPSNPPPPRRRRSMANSLISPQLEAFVGRSLDTRGIMNRKTHKPLKQEELENEEDDDEFDSKRVPNVWAAIQSIKEEEDAL